MRWTDIAGLRTLSDIAAPALLIVGRVARSDVETITADLWKQLRTTAVRDEQHIA